MVLNVDGGEKYEPLEVHDFYAEIIEENAEAYEHYQRLQHRLSQIYGSSTPMQTAAAISAHSEWHDEDEHGDKDWQAQKAQWMQDVRFYVSYVLRNDLSRVYWCHPYPTPASERMEKIWPLAKALYLEDDPANFMGPNQYEIVYVLRAMTAYDTITGENLFADVYEKLDGYPAGKYPYIVTGYDWGISANFIQDEGFLSWMRTDDFFYMWYNRSRQEDHDYTEYDAFMTERIAGWTAEGEQQETNVRDVDRWKKEKESFWQRYEAKNMNWPYYCRSFE